MRCDLLDLLHALAALEASYLRHGFMTSRGAYWMLNEGNRNVLVLRAAANAFAVIKRARR